MGCDGGPWTLNAVLLFSADFMPLLSFTHTPNNNRECDENYSSFYTFCITFSHFFFSSPFECFTSSSLQVLLKKCFVFVLSLLFAFSVRR